jgi:thiamine biosynthesis lipoprotein
MLRRVLPALVFAALLAWVALRPQTPTTTEADPRLLQRDFFAMGTLVSISAYLDAGMPRSAGETAINEIERILLDFEHRWSAWGAGELGQLNQQLARGESVVIPPALRPLFARTGELSDLSAGLFDTRVGALVKLWGFDDESHYRNTPPPAAEVAALVAKLREAPHYEDGKPYGPASGVQWDFGAIAKGYAVQLALDELEKKGIANAIVNGGGNLVLRGTHGDRPWRIGIRNPRGNDPQQILASFAMDAPEGLAVITSGDYERYFEYEGRRYHHILDPRTGEPAQGLQSVTVITHDGARADAASTALFVAGAEHWPETAKALGITQAIVVTSNGRVEITPALAALTTGAEPALSFTPEIPFSVRTGTARP